MPYYNLTQLQAATHIGDLVTFANSVTNELWMPMVLIAIYFIMLFVLKRWNFEHGLIASSFSCFLLSLALAYGGYVNFIFCLLYLILIALCGLYLYFTQQH